MNWTIFVKNIKKGCQSEFRIQNNKQKKASVSPVNQKNIKEVKLKKRYLSIYLLNNNQKFSFVWTYSKI